MKAYKISLLAFASLFLLTGCELFEKDNYPGPNAKIKGGIVDKVTGELVETDINAGATSVGSSHRNNPGSNIKVYELGYSAQTLQEWVVKQNGEYQNKMVFANHYKIEFSSCNFYPYIIEDFEIKPGQNVHNFEVTPYIRVKNASITKQGDKVVAEFNLEAGDPEVKLSEIRLFAFDDMYVGQIVKYDITEGCRETFATPVDIDSSVRYKLEIDWNDDNNRTQFFKYGNYDYYFRIGALATIPGKNVGTIPFNYAPAVALPLF